MECYERGSEVASVLMNVSTNDTAIYRLTDSMGKQCESIIEEETFREEISMTEEEILYVQSDGSMLLTRENGWKEVKVGRIFKSTSIYTEHKERQWIRKSEYVAHFGNHYDFENKMSRIIDEPYIDKSENVVFINDGAKWQWNWASAEYPLATQILDFYHVMEHVGSYIKLCKQSKIELDKVMKTLGRILKTKGVVSMINYIENIPCETKKKIERKQSLMTYINNNMERMKYPEYIKKNLLIGSGAIESAHRTVLQKRMKLSGQRWSEEGLKNMINLRVIKMSGYWDKVIDIIRFAA
jgi:hypothetical protein